MSRRRALHALSQGLRGQIPPHPDWMLLIEQANRGLVTPRLYATLMAKGVGAAIPEDALAFLSFVNQRNDERNLKLKAMAEDAVAAMNAAGVVPVPLKGMAVWGACHSAMPHFPRMMSDVDLLVRPEEADRAIDALRSHGFNLLPKDPPGSHVVAELWRDGDVGIVDLHQRPPGPPALANLFDIDAHTVASDWLGATRLPTAAHQIYLFCLHDLLHEGGFWRGGFDVRHLCDVADLANGPQPIDWTALTRVTQTKLVHNAIHSQLIAAERIAGAAIPDHIRRSVKARLHYHRHRLQYLFPRLGFPLSILGIALEARNLSDYWPFLGADQMTYGQLVWWLRKGRPYPNKI